MSLSTRFLGPAVVPATAFFFALLSPTTLFAESPQTPKLPLVVEVNDFDTFEVTFPPAAKLKYEVGFRGSDCNVMRLYSDDAGKAQFMVRPRKPGEYHVLFWLKGEDDPAQRVVIRTSPVVPPGPAPTPNPPTPGPVEPVTPPVAPPGPEGLRPGETAWGFVLIEETADASTNRAKLLAHKPLYDFLRANSWKWKLVDQNVRDETGQTPAAIKPYLSQLTAPGSTKRVPYLWVVASNGRVVWQGTPPKTGDEILNLFKRFTR